MRNTLAAREESLTDQATEESPAPLVDGPRGEPEDVATHYDRLYADGGFGYDVRRDAWSAWVAAHYIKEFELQRGETLLDVGCGDGFWTGLFADQGLVATGIDLSPGGIEQAQRDHPSAAFVVGDAEDLPFADESFDVVFCRAITHLARLDLTVEPTRRLMTSMRRVLRPGGMILISFYTKRDGGGTPDHVWHPISELLRLVETVADPFHVDVVGHYVQIGAQRPDAPRRRPSLAPKRPPRPRPTWRARLVRRVRRLANRGGATSGQG